MSTPVSPRTLAWRKEREFLEARLAAQKAVERDFGIKNGVNGGEELKAQRKVKKCEQTVMSTFPFFKHTHMIAFGARESQAQFARKINEQVPQSTKLKFLASAYLGQTGKHCMLTFLAIVEEVLMLTIHVAFRCGHESKCTGEVDGEGVCSRESDHGPVIRHDNIDCIPCINGVQMTSFNKHQEEVLAAQKVMKQTQKIIDKARSSALGVPANALEPSAIKNSVNIPMPKPTSKIPKTPLKPKPEIQAQAQSLRERHERTSVLAAVERAQQLEREIIRKQKALALAKLRSEDRDRQAEAIAKAKAKALCDDIASPSHTRFALVPDSIVAAAFKSVSAVKKDTSESERITSNHAEKGALKTAAVATTTGNPVDKTETPNDTRDEDEVWEDICIGLAEEMAEMEMEPEDEDDWVML